MQSSCHKPYLCLECAERQKKKRAKQWQDRIENLDPNRIDFVTVNAPQNFNCSQSLSYCKRYIKSMNAKGALFGLGIGKRNHGKHIHAVVLDAKNYPECKDGKYTVHCQQVTHNLPRTLRYVLKYPIIDYLEHADNDIITQEYLDILTELKNIRPTRAIGNLSNRCK